MEEIIGILVALGVLLFKVAKKINDAEDPKIKPVRPVVTPEVETEPEIETEKLEDIFTILRANPVEEIEEDVEEAPEAPKTIHFEAVQETKSRVSSPIVQAAVEETKEKEKIDPKKLVLYSEIMNRKY
jgi:hypothetical protein